MVTRAGKNVHRVSRSGQGAAGSAPCWPTHHKPSRLAAVGEDVALAVAAVAVEAEAEAEGSEKLAHAGTVARWATSLQHAGHHLQAEPITPGSRRAHPLAGSARNGAEMSQVPETNQRTKSASQQGRWDFAFTNSMLQEC